MFYAHQSICQSAIVVARVSPRSCSWPRGERNRCSDRLRFRGAPGPLRLVRVLGSSRLGRRPAALSKAWRGLTPFAASLCWEPAN